MDVRHLRYFVAVAETGSFSRAARRCSIAQPSLSQQIQRLEAEIGRPLFDRLGRSIALTPAGTTLLPRARRILDEMREASHELAMGDESGSGVLAVGAIPTLAPYVLPKAVLSFTQSCPRATLELSEDLTDRLIEALIAAELDLALVSTPIDHDGIELSVLGRDPFIVAVPRSHPLAGRESIALEELAEQPCVVLDEAHCLGQQVEELCRVMKLHLRVACRASQLSTLLELVALDLGVALVPELATHAISPDRCRFLRIGDESPYREVAVATRRGRTRSSLAERFLAGLHWPPRSAVVDSAARS